MDKKIICVEFAPDIFAHLRSLDNIQNEDLKSSMDPFLKANTDAIQKSGEGMGKSGSFFFFSHNKQLLIKTMTNDDFHAFMKLFQKYFEHINEFPNSIIARIYGVYQISMGDQKPVYLVLMGNTKNTPDEYVKYCFDLKGSMVSREVRGAVKNTYCLKDKNVLKMKDNEVFLRFQEKDVEQIIHQISLDVSLLNLYNLMDYSLLLCVQYREDYINQHKGKTLIWNNDFKRYEDHDADNEEEKEGLNKTAKENHIESMKFAEKMLSKNIEDQPLKLEEQAYHSIDNHTFQSGKNKMSRDNRHQFLSADGKYIYHISIIDYLQDYNWGKKGENMAKSMIRGSDKHLISAVPPKQYCERFYNFMKNEVIIDQRGFE